MVFRKRWFGWVQTHISNFVVSGPKFTGLISWNAGGIADEMLVFHFEYLYPVRRYSWSKFEVVINHPEFWPQIFFGGGPPKFWDLDYKIEHRPTSNHVAKVHVDRPTELGDLAVRKKTKASAVKHKPAGNYRSGRPNENLTLRTSLSHGTPSGEHSYNFFSAISFACLKSLGFLNY